MSSIRSRKKGTSKPVDDVTEKFVAGADATEADELDNTVKKSLIYRVTDYERDLIDRAIEVKKQQMGMSRLSRQEFVLMTLLKESRELLDDNESK